jgi:prolyl oligopeptidase
VRETTRLSYPPAERGDQVDLLHGVRVHDPYRWLEEIDSPATRAWIEAENALTFGYLGQILGRERIRKRVRELWNYEKYGLPFQRGGRTFFTYNDGLQNQSVLHVIDSPVGEPRVLLDPNDLSPDGTVALTGTVLSEDGTLLAYGLSAAGSDWQEWRVREVSSGRDREDHLKWVKFTTIAWTHDQVGFFYSRYAEPEEGGTYKARTQCQRLYYHRLGAPQEEDDLVYERPDEPEWGWSTRLSDEGRYLVITVWKGTHRENGVFVKDLARETSAVVELLAEFDAGYTFIGNDGSVFYFLSDLDAPMGRVIAIDLCRPERRHWRETIPESDDSLQAASLIQDRFFGLYLHNAKSRVRTFDRSGEPAGEVELPGMGTVMGFAGRRADREAFYLFTDFVTPGTVYRYDLETGQSEVFREPKVPFDSSEYVTEQVAYPSKDGTEVSLFLSHKKGFKKDGETPTCLYGYGGFNVPLTPFFSLEHLLWMEMGGIYAQANLRGGGERGKAWHEAGTKEKKQNVFDDFIAAAEWLIASGYTKPERLAIAGRSNGGLLVGACLTQRPDLFGACLIGVGVLDMLRFHAFTIGWAWTSDYGSPDDPREFGALLNYSPYHNIRPGTAYPAALITTGDHDDRVFPAHSFKFAGALQAAQGGNAPILIRIDTKAGHGLGKPTEKLIEEAVDDCTFLASVLGMNGVREEGGSSSSTRLRPSN